MKNVYQSVYDSIIIQYSGRKWFKGCHKHRIQPGYDKGTYELSNVLFVTQREHSLIHFLRWKLFKDSRDKRAQKMIGVGPSGLSHSDRIEHGMMCAEQKIGFHRAESSLKSEWKKRGRETQKIKCETEGEKNWYYWSTPAGRKERASLGGKASYGKCAAFIEQQGSFKDKKFASEAAKKSAKKPVTNGSGVIRKFHTELERDMFLKDNPTWRRGCPTKKELLQLET